MFNYRIKTKTSIFQYWNNNNKHYYFRRRYNLQEISNYSYYILALWMFVIALRIGSISLFIFYPPPEEYILTVQNIEYPELENTEMIGNKRLRTIISLSKDKKIVVDGYQVNDSLLYKHLQFIKSERPYVIAYLAIDNNCKMEEVNHLFNILMKAEIRSIFLVAKQKMPNMQFKPTAISHPAILIF